MPSNEKKRHDPKRCELCAMPTLKNPARHMDTYHAELADKTFRRLQQGKPPVGDWIYCSNWQGIWNDDDFEAKDVEFKRAN